MAKAIKQFRFFSTQADNTFNTVNTTYEKLISGSVFADVLPIYQLGIQALPGTRFYLNNAIDPIIVGGSGKYELDTQGRTTITSINFDAQSLQAISNNSSVGLIIDIVYEKGAN